MGEEVRLDRATFKRQSAEAADDTSAFWREQSDAFKLRSAYHLSLRAFGFDPADEPRLDRSVFSTRKPDEGSV